MDSLSNKAIGKGKSHQMPIFCLFHTALGRVQFHGCLWIDLVQNSVLPTTLQWQTVQVWGRIITLGLQLFLQHCLAVLDPQLVCSFQGLFTGVIEYVWKIRVVVNRTSRGAFRVCTHWLWQSHSSLWEPFVLCGETELHGNSFCARGWLSFIFKFYDYLIPDIEQILFCLQALVLDTVKN